MRIFEFTLDERKTDSDPDVVGYEEVPVKKSDPNIIDSIVVTLKGKRAERFTKLALRFDEANKIKKEMAAEEKRLKGDTMEAIEDLFEVGEEVYTRVVETASLVFKISKSGNKTVDQLDQAGYLAELEELSGLAVNELQKLKEKYIKPVTTEVVPKVLAPKKKKPVKEGVLDTVKDYSSRIKTYFTSFLRRWDKRYSHVKSQIDSILNNSI